MASSKAAACNQQTLTNKFKGGCLFMANALMIVCQTYRLAKPYKMQNLKISYTYEEARFQPKTGYIIF